MEWESSDTPNLVTEPALTMSKASQPDEALALMICSCDVVLLHVSAGNELRL